MATQEFTNISPASSAKNCTSFVQAKKTTTHDVYTGSIADLIKAGIVQQEHLAPQSNRRKGNFCFMPDGSPVPEGATIPSSLPGVLVIQIKADGRGEVRRTVSIEERKCREDAAPALCYQSEHKARYRGTREKMLRDGIPESWIDGLPIPGKKRGQRTIYDGQQKIEVNVNEAGFSIEKTHIEYYRDWGRDSYLRHRAEFGLPLIVRKHLTLVWSAPA